ncbi:MULTISPECIES: CatB-related O-acetyltransferase [unclassified Aureimonas]|uniref:CatB-related O-acetyltransferase n=1 Tax=unclassified Aureimonas TaxID=2615206 RepID=UPI000702257F|nr:MULTISPECIES: CatB-related O-acetyltransferase [unclassified Aureimonas]KQT69816.1 chloramphenicol acetyltransferase [Aureimonas sp. Leaf427]KQT76032.1 chloramphenicol acetyltransferase [Aureimonas sp. Leaf460]
MGPDPTLAHPVPAHRRIVFLKAVVDHPLIEIGDYTYYDDPEAPERFVERCVSHHYDFIGDRLIIGRFCALATGVRFVMNGANHAMTGFSTYPFNIFGGGWEAGFDLATVQAGWKGDTVVGDDVWIGEGATILPGVRIGSGAIVAMGSMVTGDVPPYAIVAGNPARLVRRRFDEATIERLLALGWWSWPADKISRNLGAIRGADLDKLEAAR